MKNVVKDAPPAAGASKVQVLKGNEYVRVWINKGGNHYLIHFPTGAAEGVRSTRQVDRGARTERQPDPSPEPF